MKNLFKFVFLLFIMASKFAFAQETDICDIRLSGKSMQLYENENFKKLVLIDNEFFQRKIDKDLLDKILKEKENFVKEENFGEIAIGLGFNNVDEMIQYYNDMNALFDELNKSDIKAYNSEDVKDASIKILCDNSSLNSRMIDIPSNNCKRKYRNCMIVALATGIGANIACGTADLTVIGGVICHSAAFALQYAMQDNCGADFEDCK